MEQVFRQEREPFVEELPVKGTSGTLILGSVRKRLKVYDIDERAHHILIVLLDRLCQNGTAETNGTNKSAGHSRLES